MERLVFDEYCIHNLAGYLLEKRDTRERVGILAKGCDSRGIVRLIQDHVITRDRLYIVGICCPGMKDPLAVQVACSGMVKGGNGDDPAPKCRECTHPNPVVYDEMVGEQQQPHLTGERFAEIKRIEAMSSEERYRYFSELFKKCLRCYACRNVCVACNCRKCIFEETRPQWAGREVNLPDNFTYHVIRAMHVAGRCVECGECQRVCPAGLPLMLLNRKLIKDINELFGPYEAGLSLEEGAKPPLSLYCAQDPDSFM